MGKALVEHDKEKGKAIMNNSGDENNEESDFFERGVDENNMLEYAKSTSEFSSESNIKGSGDDFDSGIESNEENKELSFPVFNTNDIYNPSFEIGKVFSTKKEFQEVVHSHATSFQIREYNPNHQCARTYNVKNVNPAWLNKKYIDAFRADPKKNIKGFRNDAIKRCNVSLFQAYRAKRRAVKEIEGDYDEQYAMLWDYATELRMRNLGSTVIMGLSDGT
ncbi:UNVERIFIED_CONTAM: hypothetical protein Scaly_0995800 [Sesamum calycinum]|uniref:Transposase n=1 Tax=Sesamum calycinum TaxID=2727403 RepID=A0AAW2QZD9_9LAMI